MSDRRVMIAVPLLIAAMGLTVAALAMKDLVAAGWALGCAVAANVLLWIPGGNDDDQ